MKVEHEYKRLGAWAYIAALDVHRMKLFGRCEHKSGIASFDRLVDQVMTKAPYRDARKVFWIIDNGSSHRGSKSASRLQEKYTNLVLIHGPVHASSVSHKFCPQFWQFIFLSFSMVKASKPPWPEVLRG
jgi:hypothetical protein